MVMTALASISPLLVGTPSWLRWKVVVKLYDLRGDPPPSRLSCPS
jgi:hypothetical protein